MTPEQSYNSLVANKLIKELQKRNMEGYYCPTKQDALNKALELIGKDSLISWGGSMTLNEIGLLSRLRDGSYNVLDRDLAKNPAEWEDITLKALRADFYFMSTNAITLDGKLINIDGTGNRLAALIYGPKNVIVIAGTNKIANNEEAALLRARNTAAPTNCIRLSRKTPCAEVGFCCNCFEDDCICSQILVTRRSAKKGRIKVILIGENVGY